MTKYLIAAIAVLIGLLGAAGWAAKGLLESRAQARADLEAKAAELASYQAAVDTLQGSYAEQRARAEELAKDVSTLRGKINVLRRTSTTVQAYLDTPVPSELLDQLRPTANADAARRAVGADSGAGILGNNHGGSR